MGFFKEFRDFIEKGNAIDMAVGIIVGSVMTGVVNSLVKDVVMPPIGLLIGGIDFSNWFVVINKGLGGLVGQQYATVAAAQAAGATTINIGLFLNTVVSFLITMFAVFMIVRMANKVRGQKPVGPATTRECPYCFTTINIAATKCPNCCSNLKPEKPQKFEHGSKNMKIKITSKNKQIIK